MLSSGAHRISPRQGDASQLPVRRHHRNPRSAPTIGSATISLASKGIRPAAADVAVPFRASAPGPVAGASGWARARGSGRGPSVSSTDPCDRLLAGWTQAADGRFLGARRKYGRVGAWCQQVVPVLYAERTVSHPGCSQCRTASTRWSAGPDADPAKRPRTTNASSGGSTLMGYLLCKTTDAYPVVA